MHKSTSSIFRATGASQQVTLISGLYKFECWGAEGGRGLQDGVPNAQGGRGAYVSGILEVVDRLTLFLFIGKAGANGNPQNFTTAVGGWNGGGYGGTDLRDNDASGAGGGATDIRITNGAFDNEKSLYSRIMVAAGGSGSAYYAPGAPGGGINGYNSTARNVFGLSNTSQTYGYKLGIGEDGKSHLYTPSSGAGGGYYGGLSPEGNQSNLYVAVASSGSSYISGYKGCNSVNDKGKHTGKSEHYSGYIFRSAKMLDGLKVFKSPDGVDEKGHQGDGAVKITYLVQHYCTKYNGMFKPVTHLLLVSMINSS